MCRLNSPNTEQSSNVASSENSEQDKSNDEFYLSSAQMSELENEIMTKILKYFKENYNFSPRDENSNEIYYSPIGEMILKIIFACKLQFSLQISSFIFFS